MKTIEIKLYSFEELSKDVQQKVLDKHRDINLNYEWWDFIYDDAKNIGLLITEFGLDRNRQAKGEFILSADEVAANIIRDHGNTTETYKTASKFLDNQQVIENKYEDPENKDREDELIDLESEFLNELLEDYSIMLQKEYENLYSDEMVKETILLNEYTFEDNGTMRNA